MSLLVFLAHTRADETALEEIERRPAQHVVPAWLDKWHPIAGEPLQPVFENALAESEVCTTFAGPDGFGPWQNDEMRGAIYRPVHDSGRCFRVILVFLTGAKRAKRSSLPTFLAATTWVKFRDSLDDHNLTIAPRVSHSLQFKRIPVNLRSRFHVCLQDVYFLAR
jgi:hypothetical protein